MRIIYLLSFLFLVSCGGEIQQQKSTLVEAYILLVYVAVCPVGTINIQNLKEDYELINSSDFIDKYCVFKYAPQKLRIKENTERLATQVGYTKTSSIDAILINKNNHISSHFSVTYVYGKNSFRIRSHIDYTSENWVTVSARTETNIVDGRKITSDYLVCSKLSKLK